MKKLLFVLLVIAMVSFVFVGCLPVVPSEGEGENEGEVSICPTVSITSQVAAGGKTYIKNGLQTITVTFAVPTEPVAVYVGDALKKQRFLTSGEVIMYPDAEKKVYTGTYSFGSQADDCGEAYIYVETCEICTSCKYPYTVDVDNPYAKIAVTADECTCAGVTLTFASTSSTDCDITTECCGDNCSGLDSWAIDIYAENPFNECCQTPCEGTIESLSGTGCPIFGETICLEKGVYYVVVTLLDNVGNQTKYFATVDTSAPCLPETVGIGLGVPGINSYFTTNITTSSEYEFLSGAFAGWCADAYTYISVGTPYASTNIYSSLDTSNVPACIQERPWGSVNWIMNNWTTLTPPDTNVPFTWKDVQATIWHLIHTGVTPDTCILLNCATPVGTSLGADNDNVLALYTVAYANSGYVPGSDELVAVILLVDNLCPTGGPSGDDKQMTFIGIPKNELYCRPIEVIEYISNGQGCTSWQTPIFAPVDDLTIGNCV